MVDSGGGSKISAPDTDRHEGLISLEFFFMRLHYLLQVFLFCLAVAVHGLPVEPEAEPAVEADHIIKYDDEELGHGHVQTGVPGEMVEGALYYKVKFVCLLSQCSMFYRFQKETLCT